MCKITYTGNPEKHRKTERQEMSITQPIVDTEFDELFYYHDAAYKVTMVMRDGSTIRVVKV